MVSREIAIRRAGTTRLTVSTKVCIDRAGVVTAVTFLRHSGFAAYDATIEREMRSWRYRPFLVNGAAAPVCTAVTFVYQQSD